MRSLEWVLIHYDWYPYKKKLGYRQEQREDTVKTKEKTVINKSRKEKAIEGTNFANTLSSDYCLSRSVCGTSNGSPRELKQPHNTLVLTDEETEDERHQLTC